MDEPEEFVEENVTKPKEPKRPYLEVEKEQRVLEDDDGAYFSTANEVLIIF